MPLWIEEYGCGCSMQARARALLLGYCATHGADRRSLYVNGIPADEATVDKHRRIAEADRDQRDHERENQP